MIIKWDLNINIWKVWTCYRRNYKEQSFRLAENGAGRMPELHYLGNFCLPLSNKKITIIVCKDIITRMFSTRTSKFLEDFNFCYITLSMLDDFVAFSYSE